MMLIKKVCKQTMFKFYSLRLLVLLFVVCFSTHTSNAQTGTDTSGLYDMSIEQLMQLKAFGVSSETEQLINALISTASNRPFSTRETPNIVTVITAEEIRRSGARDLVDVLRLVPGIDMGQDVEGVVSIGVRGLWGGEGKVLVQVDGQELNETLYGFVPMGNCFPVERINRIEIIRGPGSIVNGGFAEYAVINIITDAFSSEKQATVDSHAGATARGLTKYGAGGQVWFKQNQVQVSIRASYNDAYRSDREHVDVFGEKYDMFGSSLIHNQQAALNLKWKKTRFNYTYNLYNVATRSPFDSTYTNIPIFDARFENHRIALSNSFSLSKKWTLDPFLSYAYYKPWESRAYPGYYPYSRCADRTKIRLNTNYKFKRKMAIVIGSEFFIDRGRALIDSLPFISGKNEVMYYNSSGFAEFSWKTRFVNILTGVRFDHNSGFGNALVPRIALTKKFGHFNYKILYNESFKAPTIENVDIQTAAGIRAELSRSFELEVGYLIGRKAFVSANLFQVTSNNPIVYYYDADQNLDQYINGRGAGTRGGELEFNYRDSLFSLRFSYSYYSARGLKKIESAIVPGHSNLLLAFPAHKASLSATYIFPKEIACNVSAQFLGERFDYSSRDSLGTKQLTRIEPELMLNIFISRDNLFHGFDIGLGCYNILNSTFPIILPYANDLAPIPSLSREFSVRVRYRFAAQKTN